MSTKNKNELKQNVSVAKDKTNKLPLRIAMEGKNPTKNTRVAKPQPK